MTPAGAGTVSRGHQVWVENNGGAGTGFDNASYEAAGAHIVASAEEIFANAELVIKAEEPQPNECRMLRPGRFFSPTCISPLTRSRLPCYYLPGYRRLLMKR